MSESREKFIGRICIVFGTRPEIIKMAPVVRACMKKKIPFFILHTGQHYSYKMDKIFLDELGIPTLDYHLGVGSGTHAVQTAQMLTGIEDILMEEKPTVVLVEGDTNSVLAGALAAAKLNIPVGHVEAGLRSYDPLMPEEKNRVLTDHLSQYLFAPTREGVRHLREEGIAKKKIFLTGNTIVDALRQQVEVARATSKILETLHLTPKKYILVTLHRPENVDIKEHLIGIIRGLQLVSQKQKLPVVWPLHPRTKERLERFDLSRSLQSILGIQIVEPVGFHDFLMLERHARLILTDSGGVQEEACIMQVPSVTLRENTERPETLRVGASMLAGTDPARILKAANAMLAKKRIWKNPFGDGKAGERIVKILCQKK